MRRFIMQGSVFALFLATVWHAAQAAEDTTKAAETRKLLQQKVTVDYTDMTLSEALDDLKTQVKGLSFRLDTAGGVSKNTKMSYKADDKTVADVLEGMFKKNGLGYIVISKKGDAYDGSVKIKQGKERGYAMGEEPSKGKDKPVADKGKTSAKTLAKNKATKAKDADEAKSADKTDDDTEKAEHEASIKYNFAKILADDGKTARAKQRLEELIAKYPKTKAAGDAKELLKKLEDK